MRKYVTTWLLIGMGFCQKKSISDGQYTFYKKDELIEKRILNSNVITTTLDKDSYDKTCYPDLSTFDKLYMRKMMFTHSISMDLMTILALMVNNPQLKPLK